MYEPLQFQLMLHNHRSYIWYKCICKRCLHKQIIIETYSPDRASIGAGKRVLQSGAQANEVKKKGGGVNVWLPPTPLELLQREHTVNELPSIGSIAQPQVLLIGYGPERVHNDQYFLIYSYKKAYRLQKGKGDNVIFMLHHNYALLTQCMPNVFHIILTN